MALAGIFGDLLGLRTSFLVAGAVVGVSAVVAFVMFRSASTSVQVLQAAQPAG